MNNYGLVAVVAARNAEQNGIDPEAAWRQAADEIIVGSKAVRHKGCPRGAFLGLCEEGYVTGIRPGDYTRSRYNKRLALKVVQALSQTPELAGSVDRLWSAAMGSEAIGHNGQADVVVELWNNGLLVLGTAQ